MPASETVAESRRARGQLQKYPRQELDEPPLPRMTADAAVGRSLCCRGPDAPRCGPRGAMPRVGRAPPTTSSRPRNRTREPGLSNPPCPGDEIDCGVAKPPKGPGDESAGHRPVSTVKNCRKSWPVPVSVHAGRWSAGSSSGRITCQWQDLPPWATGWARQGAHCTMDGRASGSPPPAQETRCILYHKPTGEVCSRKRPPGSGARSSSACQGLSPGAGSPLAASTTTPRACCCSPPTANWPTP